MIALVFGCREPRSEDQKEQKIAVLTFDDTVMVKGKLWFYRGDRIENEISKFKNNGYASNPGELIKK